MDEKEKETSDLELTDYGWIDTKTGIEYATDEEAYEAQKDDD